MSAEQSQEATYAVPTWASFLSWSIPLTCCVALIWLREAPWTKGTVPGIVLTYVFGWMWVRMAVRVSRGEAIPGFLRKPPLGMPKPTGWLDSPPGTLVQASLLWAAAMGLAAV